MDHNKSSYSIIPGVMAAYRRLWELLETRDGQIIWCFCDPDPKQYFGGAQPDREYVQWALEVPKAAILAFVDKDARDRIVWSEHPHAQDQYVAQREANVVTSPEELRSRLLVQDDSQRPVQAIIPCPIDAEWLLECRLIGPTNQPSAYRATCLSCAARNNAGDTATVS